MESDNATAAAAAIAAEAAAAPAARDCGVPQSLALGTVFQLVYCNALRVPFVAVVGC